MHVEEKADSKRQKISTPNSTKESSWNGIWTTKTPIPSLKKENSTSIQTKPKDQTSRYPKELRLKMVEIDKHKTLKHRTISKDKGQEQANEASTKCPYASNAPATLPITQTNKTIPPNTNKRLNTVKKKNPKSYSLWSSAYRGV